MMDWDAHRRARLFERRDATAQAGRPSRRSPLRVMGCLRRLGARPENALYGVRREGDRFDLRTWQLPDHQERCRAPAAKAWRQPLDRRPVVRQLALMSTRWTLRRSARAGA